MEETISQERSETIFWQESFEEAYEWTSYDATLTDAAWHITNNDLAYQGNSWWMGDPAIGGYLDHVYVVLDTDPILVPENGTLTFKLYYSCEPAGTDSSTPEYNGWDGCNVRISTDGETWNVISGAPAYTASSLYSFGVEHGEGPNVPGWTGASEEWIDAEFDLSAYNGQNVQIRFAFASDPATNTSDNSDYVGMLVDDIQLGSFQNVGSTTNMIPGNMVEGGGDHWHEIANGYESATAVECSEAGFIDSGWENYFESEQFFLDDEGEYALDCYLKGTFDADSYWGCEVSYRLGNIWSDWYNITNPTNLPDVENYVFAAPGDSWQAASEIYDVFPVDLTAVSGHYVKLRIYLKTSDEASGNGISFDDFTITETTYPGDAPTNLIATLNEDHSVNLEWISSDIPEVLGYNIYRFENEQYEMVSTTTESNFIDENPINETINTYVVTASYIEEETDYSEPTSIFVPADTASWLIHDDGTSESGYNVGTLNKMAVGFETENSYVTHLQIYLQDVGTADLNFKIWNSDAIGIPTDELCSWYVDAETLQTGWNFIFIPEDIRPFIEEGTFHVGLQEFTGSALVGLDEDTAGNSLVNVDGTWGNLSGNLMIRTLVDVDQLSSPSEQIELPDYALHNYPNPFYANSASRAATTISFNLPDAKFTQLEIYNLRGQKVKTLAAEKMSSGEHNLAWDGKDAQQKSVCSGIYFYRLNLDGKTVANKKLLILK